MGEFEAPDLRGVDVLIVDDNEDARAILTAFLRHFGALVRAAATGADGIAAVRERRPDVIVSDLAMPAMDGHEFLTHVRRLPGQSDRPTPAIAFSGFPGEADRAKTSGYAVFIRKPADPLLISHEIKRRATVESDPRA